MNFIAEFSRFTCLLCEWNAASLHHLIELDSCVPEQNCLTARWTGLWIAFTFNCRNAPDRIPFTIYLTSCQYLVMISKCFSRSTRFSIHFLRPATTNSRHHTNEMRKENILAIMTLSIFMGECSGDTAAFGIIILLFFFSSIRSNIVIRFRIDGSLSLFFQHECPSLFLTYNVQSMSHRNERTQQSSCSLATNAYATYRPIISFTDWKNKLDCRFFHIDSATWDYLRIGIIFITIILSQLATLFTYPFVYAVVGFMVHDATYFIKS